MQDMWAAFFCKMHKAWNISLGMQWCIKGVCVWGGGGGEGELLGPSPPPQVISLNYLGQIFGRIHWWTPPPPRIPGHAPDTMSKLVSCTWSMKYLPWEKVEPRFDKGNNKSLLSKQNETFLSMLAEYSGGFRGGHKFEWLIFFYQNA